MNKADVFAWKPFDMPGIPHGIAEHGLNIKADIKLMQQRLCYFDKEKRRAIGEEIARLLDADFIREV